MDYAIKKFIGNATTLMSKEFEYYFTNFKFDSIVVISKIIVLSKTKFWSHQIT